MFAIRVIAKFDRDFICVHEMRYINLKDFRFHSELRNDF